MQAIYVYDGKAFVSKSDALLLRKYDNDLYGNIQKIPLLDSEEVQAIVNRRHMKICVCFDFTFFQGDMRISIEKGIDADIESMQEAVNEQRSNPIVRFLLPPRNAWWKGYEFVDSAPEQPYGFGDIDTDEGFGYFYFWLKTEEVKRFEGTMKEKVRRCLKYQPWLYDMMNYIIHVLVGT